MTPKSDHTKPNLREEISKILIKWDMPTRQAAINELVQFVEHAVDTERKHRATVVRKEVGKDE